MGSLLTAILQGAGRSGNELTEAKNANLQEQQKLQQFKQQLAQLNQKMQLEKAPQFVGSHADPKGQIFNTQRDPMTGKLTDTAGGKEAPKESWSPILDADGNYAAFDKTTGKMAPLELDGKQVKGVPKGKNGPLTVDGKPVGVWRSGKPITPDDPDWTPGDAVQLARYLKGYGDAEANKDARVKLSAQSRAWAWMQMPIGVYDADTNSMTEVSREQVSKNPGKYAPPGPAMQIINQHRLFNEIDATTQLVNGAIAKLPNDAFDPEARIQIAAALRDENPASVFHQFLTSEAASTLSKEQIEYVTDLVSLQESAMALRSIGALGQGTDKIRNAIQKMLPSGSTPSKYYAMQQMTVFQTEVEALRRNIANAGRPGTGAGNQSAPAGPQKGETKDYQGHKYEFDGKQWVMK